MCLGVQMIVSSRGRINYQVRPFTSYCENISISQVQINVLCITHSDIRVLYNTNTSNLIFYIHFFNTYM